jgi:hypothetical protein
MIIERRRNKRKAERREERKRMSVTYLILQLTPPSSQTLPLNETCSIIVTIVMRRKMIMAKNLIMKKTRSWIQILNPTTFSYFRLK